jgi:integrase
LVLTGLVILEMRDFTRWMRETRNPDCPYMFQRDGKPIRDFRAAFESACVRVGVPDLLFHDQRRTAVTNMIRAGVPEKDAMAVSGHLDRSMLARYTIVKEQDVKRAGNVLAERFRERRAAKPEKLWDQLWDDRSGEGQAAEPPNGPKYKQ